MNNKSRLWDISTALAISPHRDDYELGAGGTIARLLSNGATVYGAIFCLARIYSEAEFDPANYELEAMNGARALGINPDNITMRDLPVHNLPAYRQTILQTLVDLKAKLNPDLVLIPSCQDIHQDHATVSQEAVRAFKDTTILGYEMPWNNLTFSPQCIVALDDSQVLTKLRAINQYESQAGRSYCAHDFLVSWVRFRGTQIHAKYGEAFEVIRWAIR